MKKALLFLFVAVALGAVFGFRAVSGAVTAEVEQVQGLYIFHMSKPTSEFKYLGTVKTPAVVSSKDFETILGIFVKRAKADYPDANALIVRDWEADAVIIGQ